MSEHPDNSTKKKIAKLVGWGAVVSAGTGLLPLYVMGLLGAGALAGTALVTGKLAELAVEGAAYGTRKLKERARKGYAKGEPPPLKPLPPPTPAELVILAEEAYEAEIELIDGMPLSADKKNLAKRRAERKLTARVQALLGGHTQGGESWPI